MIRNLATNQMAGYSESVGINWDWVGDIGKGIIDIANNLTKPGTDSTNNTQYAIELRTMMEAQAKQNQTMFLVAGGLVAAGVVGFLVFKKK